MDHRDKQEKQQLEEYKKNPTINMADSMNRSVSGDLGVTRGSFLTRIITTLVIIGGLLVFLLLK